MALITSGQSGGVLVSALTAGVTLTLVNDYAQILPSNAAPTQGPDAAGIIAIAPSPNYGGGGVLTFEQVIPPVGIPALPTASWQPLFGVVTTSNGQTLGVNVNTFALAPSQSVSFTLVSVQPYYAIRVRLSTAPSSGVILVTGQTFGLATGAINPAVSAFYAQDLQLLQALVLALSDLNSTDYLSAVGGSF